MIFEDKELPFPCSSQYLEFMLKIRHKIQNHNKQVMGALGGMPGSGKSCRAQEIMYIVSAGKHSQDKIVFNKQEFSEAVDIAFKEAVIVDEGLAVLFSREAMRREGVEVEALIGEIRQRNLAIIICIWDLLSLDRMAARMLDFVAMVTDGERYINGRKQMVKGNMEIWLKTKRHNYVFDFLKWLRAMDTNPRYAGRRPHPQIRVPGSVYREGESEGFYCVDKAWYINKKESVRKRHKGAFNRKAPNRDIDFAKMDKLIKAGMRSQEIAEILNTGIRVVQMRKKERRIKRGRKRAPRLKGRKSRRISR